MPSLNRQMKHETLGALRIAITQHASYEPGHNAALTSLCGFASCRCVLKSCISAYTCLHLVKIYTVAFLHIRKRSEVYGLLPNKKIRERYILKKQKAGGKKSFTFRMLNIPFTVIWWEQKIENTEHIINNKPLINNKTLKTKYEKSWQECMLPDRRYFVKQRAKKNLVLAVKSMPALWDGKDENEIPGYFRSG